MNTLRRFLVPAMLLVALVAVAGCKKKPAPPPPAPPPPPVTAPAPTAEITATPTTITAGDQVVLTWRTTNATSAAIDGIGDVPTSGTKTVTPSQSTSYHLTARGEGGTAEATASVTVNAPPAVQQPPAVSEEEEFMANVKPIFFDYDKADIRADAQATLSKNASFLANHPDIKFVIGGYCDERGSVEYNIGLGQNRADATKTALVNAGVSADRIRVISYGKEKPFCTEHTEDCWQSNRRAGFAMEH